ncbi:MAG: hypothetical protein ACR2N9_07475 [Acidimicrobiia bacterium]
MGTEDMTDETTDEGGTTERDGSLTPEEIKTELDRRGHIVTSWDEIGSITLPTEAVATMYKIGMPDSDASPTVFKMWFPPGCTIESHTHDCDYSEIVLEGSQMVGRKWLYPGDIRIGLANRGYGPLVAGPEGASVLVIFANGRWPGIPLGTKNDGSTLATPEITDRFEVA